ncbi:unnamed protein product, partial [Iphiclides podalirius]
MVRQSPRRHFDVVRRRSHGRISSRRMKGKTCASCESARGSHAAMGLNLAPPLRPPRAALPTREKDVSVTDCAT